MLGRWTILFDESLSRFEQRNATRVSEDIRSGLRGPWIDAGDLDVSSTTITFNRPAGQESFSYEVLRVTVDAIALRLYHNHNEFRLSLKRDGPLLAMGPGSCDFTEGGCDLEFFFQRRDNP